MKTRMSLVAGAMAMLSGCLLFYAGSEEGPFGVVAERNEPGRQKEVILKTAGRANWYVVFGPDGVGKDTYFRSIRYYIASGGKTNSLSHATKWAYDDTAISYKAGPCVGRGLVLLTARSATDVLP